MKTYFYRYSAKTNPDTEEKGIGRLTIDYPTLEAKTSDQLLADFHHGILLLATTEDRAGTIDFYEGSRQVKVGEFTAEHDVRKFIVEEVLGIAMFVNGIYSTEKEAKLDQFFRMCDEMAKLAADAIRADELGIELLVPPTPKQRAMLEQMFAELRRLSGNDSPPTHPKDLDDDDDESESWKLR